jgi:2-polyprenyl-6-methoxyphenol hydroxylase-like FAD-dependent oxidoreductase
MRHVEVAGAGFAGLTVSGLLARDGWSARVHERADAVREVGAGIFMHNNGLQVLAELGLMPELEGRGVQLTWEKVVDGKGRLIRKRNLVDSSRIWSVPRQVLIDILHSWAVKQGAEIITASQIVSASSDGILTDDAGHEYRGDLVVGADGYNSAVRRSLGITCNERRLSTTSIRYLLGDRELTPDPGTTEHWSGRRRVALAACGPSHTYLYMACPDSDQAASQVPLNVDVWSASFPALRDVFCRLAAEEAYKSWYPYVRSTTWSSGTAVLVGDSAHALAPTLGQGTNLAMTNALSLLAFLNRHDTVAEALTRWEKEVRPVTDATQKWAGHYDALTKYWPPALGGVRKRIIWAFSASDRLNAHMRLADSTPPVFDAVRGAGGVEADPGAQAL